MQKINNYLDSFVVQGYEVPSWNQVESKVQDIQNYSKEPIEHLNPIEQFIYMNEVTDNEMAIEQRHNLKELIEYIIEKI